MKTGIIPILRSTRPAQRIRAGPQRSPEFRPRTAPGPPRTGPRRPAIRAAPRADRPGGTGRAAGSRRSGPGRTVDARGVHPLRPAAQHRGPAARPRGRTQRHRAFDGPLQPAPRPERLAGRRRLVRPGAHERQHLPRQQPDLGIAERLGLDAALPGHAHQPPDQGREVRPRGRRAGPRTHPRGRGDQRHDALPPGALTTRSWSAASPGGSSRTEHPPGRTQPGAGCRGQRTRVGRL